MRLQIDLSLLLPGDFYPRCIIAGVEQSAASEPTLSFGRANELQRGLITDQWLSSPVLTDKTEQVVLNRIPFGSAGWQMCDRNLQVEFICQLLQPKFPQPAAIAIGAAAVGFNQQPSSPRISRPPLNQQPSADDRDGELRSLMHSTK